MDKYTGLEIAIIGIAGRFPGANDINQFWDNLKNGVESIGFFSMEELKKAGEDPELINNPLYVGANGYLEGKEYFDSAFFNYRPDEAKIMDPQMRLFHECVWEALEDAGCNPYNNENKIGVFAGAANNTNWEVNARLLNKEGLVDSFSASQISDARFVSSKISYLFNLRGPSLFLDTACSTSLVAIHQGCKSLLMAECNIAIAGGVSISSKSKKGYLYTEGLIQSKDGHCRAFDAEATGTVGGEGVAIVVLKLLKNAIKDGDNIWAVIKGSGINNDGNNKVGYTAPSMDGQTEAIIMAHKWARVEPESITFVEAHGTATKLGDPIEVEALNRAFGKSEEKYCAIGSVKTNVGHLDTAAGAAGFIKAVLSLKNKQIPPSLNFKVPNPEIDFDHTPFYVNTTLKEWKNDKFPLRAGVSSFGIGGTNVHFVLEEMGERKFSPSDRPYHLLIFSAKTPTALAGNIAKFRKYFEENSTRHLDDVAYTLKIGRQSFSYRKIFVCKNSNEALAALRMDQNIDASVTSTPNKLKGVVVFMFTGAGAQYENMYRGLYETETYFKNQIDKCFLIANRLTGKDFKSIIYPQHSTNVVNSIENTQPALFIMEYSLAKFLMHLGVKPDIMIGHSFGEYVAACISGVFTLEDALTVIIKRGELMLKTPPGTMLNIAISEKDLREILHDFEDIALAAINSSDLCVVSGDMDSIQDFKSSMEQRGYQCKLLQVSVAGHSRLMEGILSEFEREVSRIKINRPEIPFISNLTGALASFNEIGSPDYWVKHLRHTVRFADGVATVLQNKEAIFIELGPANVLSTFVRNHKQRLKNHNVVNLVRHPGEDIHDGAYFLEGLGKLWMGGLDISWKTFYEDEQRTKVSLPTYAFDKVIYPINIDSARILAMIGSKPLKAKANVSEWFYTPTWKMVTQFLHKDTYSKKRWNLILADTCGVSDFISMKLVENGEQTICVHIGDKFIERSETSFEINPSHPEDFTSLFMILSKKEMIPERFIHCWAVNKQNLIFSEQSFEYDCNIYFYSLINIFKASQAFGGVFHKQVVVISSGLHDVVEKRSKAPIKSIVLPLLKVASQEFPGVVTSHIDISLEEDITGGLMDKVVNEIQTKEAGKVVSFRKNSRWIQIYDKLNYSESPSSGIKNNGVYLISGGIGELGFNYAKYLITKYKAKVILLGRTKIAVHNKGNSVASPNVTDNSGQKAERIEELKRIGDALYFECEVSNREAVMKSLKAAIETFGEINGVFHAAGIINGNSLDKPVGEFSRNDFESQFKAKIFGLNILCEIFRDKKLDFFVASSSISAVLGGLGFGAYAPANVFMDYYIKSLCEHEGLNWTSVNYDRWDFSNPDTIGINGIEMLSVFEWVTSLKNFPQVALSTTDLQERLRKWVNGNRELEVVGNKVDYNNTKPEAQLNFPSGKLRLEFVQESLVRLWQDFFGKQDITIDETFFESGGDSLKVITMVGRIHKVFNVEISIKDFFNNPTIRKLAVHINSVKKNVKYSPICAAESKEHYSLSSAQKRLYFLHEFEKLSLAYNIPQVVRLEGILNLTNLREAFLRLIDRHESLRTIFLLKNDLPVQKILTQVPFDIQCFSASESDVPGIVKDFIRPFDLTQAPLMRVGLVEISSTHNVLIIDTHHIISDGISQGIFLRDLISLYKNDIVPPLRLQYKDYAEWQQNPEQQAAVAKQKEFWLNEFADEVSILGLPLDHTRPLTKGSQGSSVNFSITSDETKILRQYAELEGATLYMVVLAVFNILLSKLSNQETIIIGTPSAGRPHPDLEDILGMFVNTIPVISHPAGSLTFLEFLNQVKQKTLLCFENQGFQYEELVEELKLNRDTSRNPLFDVMFVYQNFERPTISLPGVSIGNYDYKNVTSKFDVLLECSENNEHLVFNWQYDTQLFSIVSIQKFIDKFKYLISQILTDSGLKISSLNLVEQNEHEELLRFNSTCTAYDEGSTINSLFESQVSKNPDSIALVFRDEAITYRELNKRANQLARILRNRGVVAGEIVGVMQERSFEMITSLLAIIKAGGAYVPLDPGYPDERLKYMIADSQVSLILTDKDLSHLKISSDLINVLSINLGIEDETDQKSFNSSSDLLYIIYTSGSTGKPKGVKLKHSNLTNLLNYQTKQTDIDFSCVLQFTTLSFDVSFQEIFSTLLYGGRLILVDKDDIQDFFKLFDIIRRNEVKTLFMPASILNQIFNSKEYSEEAPTSLKHIVTAGEQVVVGDIFSNYLRKNEIFLHNHYGPSETHVVTTHTVSPYQDIPQMPCIGKPIQNTRIYILDKYQRYQPIGIPGEIYIGGKQVGLGYVNNSQLNSERFVKSPFDDKEILYKTGDLGKWLPDGNIVFLGRIDNQIKIRGFRIELGEIETQLVQYDLIQEAVVVVKEHEGNKYLVAYYVSENKIDNEKIKNFLSERLPNYMVPVWYVQMQKFPLTPNFKLNKRALPDPQIKLDSDYQVASNETEAMLIKIWQNLLNSDQIGINDNFFELGGHSLLAMRMVLTIKKEMGILLPLKALFQFPNIKLLANFISNEISSTTDDRQVLESLTKVNEQEISYTTTKSKTLYYEITPRQIWWVNDDDIEFKRETYGLITYKISGEFDIEVFKKSVYHLVSRHESLRSTFHKIEGQYRMQVLSEKSHLFNVDFVEFTSGDNFSETEFVAFDKHEFNLIDGPLFLVRLIKCEDSGYLVSFKLHHVIYDAWSLQVLFRDLMILYDSFLNNQEPSLPELKFHYKEFMARTNLFVKMNRESHRQFWYSLYTALPGELILPGELKRRTKKISGRVCEIATFNFSKETLDVLTYSARKHSTSIFIILQACLKWYLYRVTGQRDIVIGTESFGRDQEMETNSFNGIGDQIGFYARMNLIRTVLEKGDSLDDCIMKVKKSHEDTRLYSAFTLLEALDEMLPPSQHITGVFWKITMQYNDQNGYIDNPSAFQGKFAIDLISNPVHQQIQNIDLKLDFKNLKNELEVKLAYNVEIYNEHVISQFVEGYLNCLSQLGNDLKTVSIQLE